MSAAPQQAWYRQGIVWLGAAVFAASMAGSVWLIHVAERYTDPPLPAADLPAGPRLLKVPLARAAAPQPAAPSIAATSASTTPATDTPASANAERR